MRAAERGFLLLTSHLGDPECKPLTVAQFRSLIGRIKQTEKPVEDRELTADDLCYIGAFASAAASLSTETAGGIPSIPEKCAVLAAM